MTVEDVVNNTKDQLDFRDRVVKMALGWRHLVVATSSQVTYNRFAEFCPISIIWDEKIKGTWLMVYYNVHFHGLRIFFTRGSNLVLGDGLGRN